MEKFILKIELLSDTIFSGGETIVSVSDIDILYDDNSIPYYKGKSIKGNLREVIETLVKNQRAFDEKKAEKNEKILVKLFGKKFENKVSEEYRDRQVEGILKFENASLGDDIVRTLQYLIDTEEITPEELISSLTDIRYATKIKRETGTSQDHSLRSMRVLNRGVVFYADIYSEQNLSDEELGLLVCGVNCLRHLGTLRSRGKGEVKCTLIRGEKEIDKKEVVKLLEGVIG